MWINNFNLILSAFILFIMGYTTLYILLKKAWITSHKIIFLTLSVGAGLGITSCLYYISLHLSSFHISTICLELLCFIPITFLFLNKYQRTLPLYHQIDKLNAPSPKSLATIVYGGIFLFFASLLMDIIMNPHGSCYDAYAIWNMKARFLFRGGEQWTQLFNLPSSWMHTDYPLLLPTSTARIWTYLNFESTLVPQALCLVFPILTFTLLYAGLKVFCERKYALVAILILATSMDYFEWSYSQISDIPLAFYYLCSIITLYLYETTQQKCFLVLTGAFGGFSAWTKNEGLVFLGLLVLIVFVISLRKKRQLLNNIFTFLLGLLPFALIIIHFKLSHAPPNDLFKDFDGMFHNFQNMQRWQILIQTFIVQQLTLNGGLPVVMALFIFFNRKSYTPCLTSLMVPLPLLSYFLIYLITPFDLEWHLTTSLERLFMQLWPSFIFISFILFFNKKTIGTTS